MPPQCPISSIEVLQLGKGSLAEVTEAADQHSFAELAYKKTLLPNIRWPYVSRAFGLGNAQISATAWVQEPT
jgi:hypothetical protein